MPQLVRLPIVLLLLALAGCGVVSQPRAPAACSGPMVTMNPDKWAPTPEDLR